MSTSSRRVSTFFCLIALAIAHCTNLGTGAFAQAVAENTRHRPDKPRWLNNHADVDTRARALLGEMTLAEKIGQLWQLHGMVEKPTGDADGLVSRSELYDLIRRGQLGSVLSEVRSTTINEMQRVALEESRLSVPLIIGRDVVHGFRTIFPIPLGQAASWNPVLVERFVSPL